jgi:hypothetical protein
MIMRLVRMILLAGVAILPTPGIAADEALCPDAVKVQQSGTAPAPGWSVSYSKAPNELEMVTFFNGPPQDEASLVYDEWIDAKAESIATWKFPKDPRGYWVRCSYRGTTMEIAKALPASLASCRVIYERRTNGASGLPAIKRIACR